MLTAYFAMSMMLCKIQVTSEWLAALLVRQHSLTVRR